MSLSMVMAGLRLARETWELRIEEQMNVYSRILSI